MLHDMEKEVNNFGQYVEQKEVINATEAVDEAGEVQVVDPERQLEISQEERRVTDMVNEMLKFILRIVSSGRELNRIGVDV